MKIGELAKRTGLSAHTIRYYERIGLLPYADTSAASEECSNLCFQFRNGTAGSGRKRPEPG